MKFFCSHISREVGTGEAVVQWKVGMVKHLIFSVWRVGKNPLVQSEQDLRSIFSLLKLATLKDVPTVNSDYTSTTQMSLLFNPFPLVKKVS